MDTLTDTQEMPSLDQRVVNYFEEACRALDGSVPTDVLKDIRFFILSPDMQPTCRTNTRVAFQVGCLSATATGINALYVQVLWLCIMAKDMWQKGSFMPAMLDCAAKAELLLEAGQAWQKANISF